MATVYSAIPTRAAFEKDSSVLIGTRSAEHMTLQVDAALAAYHAGATEGFARQLALVMLFGATDRWLKHVDAAIAGGTKPVGADKGRRAAMYELFKIAVQELSAATGVPVNLLPNWLQATFGRDLGLHGIDLDVKDGLAKSLSPTELERYRLHVIGGLVYQRNWWARGDALVPANSATCTMVINGALDPLHVGDSGYAMTMAQDFYMAPHMVSNKTAQGFDGNFYHSSYRGGATVACAGTIRIVEGKVEKITNLSGHYQPTTGHLAFAVEALRLLGVDIVAMKVKGFGIAEQSASVWLASLRHEALATTNRETHFPALDRDRQRTLREIENARIASAHKTHVQTELLLAHWMSAQGHKGRMPREFERDKCKACVELKQYWPQATAKMQARQV